MTTRTFKTDLRNWGSSSGVIIPKLIMKDLNIIEGDKIELTIKKIEETPEKVYRCLLCGYILEGSEIPEDNILFCPCCLSDDRRGFEEVLNK